MLARRLGVVALLVRRVLLVGRNPRVCERRHAGVAVSQPNRQTVLRLNSHVFPRPCRAGPALGNEYGGYGPRAGTTRVSRLQKLVVLAAIRSLTRLAGVRTI